MRVPLLAILFLPVALSAQASRDSLISVNLTRTVTVAPDRATWFITIEGTAETTQAALALADTKVAAVTRALGALGRPIRLGVPIPFAVAPTLGMRAFSGAPTVTTVTARTALRVDVLNLADIARVLAAASEAGAAGSSGLQFTSSLADSARRAEITAALAVARLEADGIAASLGGRIGGLVEVSTSSNDLRFSQALMLPVDGMGPPPMAPEVTGTVTVTARFRLAP